MYGNGNDGSVPKPAQVFGVGSCEYLGPCLLLTPMTCSVLGSKPEGQDLHFEQISQLCKLTVLSFLQTPLRRRAFWQKKTLLSRILKIFNFGAARADDGGGQTLQSVPGQEGWERVDATRNGMCSGMR